MIVITDDHLKRFTPAQILGLRSPAPNLLREDVRAYVPQSFHRLRELVTAAYCETMQEGIELTNPKHVAEYLRLRIEGLEHEEFHALWMNSRNHLICADCLFNGTVTQTSVYPREVVKRGLEVNSSGVIFAHNHPGGSTIPSRADEMLTRALREALSLVDIKVLDHLIVAPGHNPTSFAERGLM